MQIKYECQIYKPKTKTNNQKKQKKLKKKQVKPTTTLFKHIE